MKTSLALVLASALGAFGPMAIAQSAPADPAGTRFYANGQIQSQIEQTRSRRTERAFYPTGVMQHEIVYAMDGAKPIKEREVQFTPAGTMLREQKWVGGEPQLDVEFLASGVLRSRKEYMGLGSTREMVSQSYFASGVLASEERMAVPSSGKPFPVGVQKSFDASGRLIQERNYDDNGRLVSEKSMGPAGALVQTR